MLGLPDTTIPTLADRVLASPTEPFFPAGSDEATLIRRQQAARRALAVAGQMWAWLPPVGTDTLEQTVIFFGEHKRGTALEVAVEDFIASFVPGGLTANWRGMPEELRRACMVECKTAARRLDERYSRQLNQPVQARIAAE